MRSDCECVAPERARHGAVITLLLSGFHGFSRLPWCRTRNRARPCLDNGPPGPARAALLVACLWALANSITVMPAQAGVHAQTEVCPVLLMDFECAQRQQRLEQASDRGAREQIAREFRELLDERRKACPQATGPSHRPRHSPGALNRW